MSGAAQLPLDLGHRPALGREDFLVVACNEVAVAWIDRWPDWPASGLALYGPPGCGKSHLCQVWRSANGAIEIDAAALAEREPPDLLGPAVACVLDDAETALGADPRAERTLLHLLNMLTERRGHLLLTGRTPPARWPCRLPDLRSRLSALPAVELGAADDMLVEAVLVKLFADRQLRVGPEVLRFALARMERSVAAARALVAAIDRASLIEHREITVPLVRRVMAADDGAPSPGDASQQLT